MNQNIEIRHEVQATGPFVLSVNWKSWGWAAWLETEDGEIEKLLQIYGPFYIM